MTRPNRGHLEKFAFDEFDARVAHYAHAFELLKRLGIPLETARFEADFERDFCHRLHRFTRNLQGATKVVPYQFYASNLSSK